MPIPGKIFSFAISMIVSCGVSLYCGVSLCRAQTFHLLDISATAGIQTAARGTGISAFDFDRDGWDDITIALKDRAPGLFRNNHDGTFTDVATQYNITGNGNLVIPIWADVNNDDLPDLFVGHRSEGKNTLWLNQGNNSFTDVTDSFGIAPAVSLGSAAFGDVNGDGFIDLFFAVRGGLDILYQNINGSRFQDVSELAGIQGGDGVPHYLDAWQSVWTDYDRDGDVDLFAVRDFDSSTRLHLNDGSFPMVDIATDANIAFNGFGYSMGMAWGDVNGDGWQDAYITRIQLGGLYLSDGQGVFSDVAAERGAERNGVSWGVIFSDFENDGDDDLFIVSDRSWQGTESILYINREGFFTESSQSTGIPFDFLAQGLTSGDFNNDGLLDFAVSSINGDHRVLINDTINAGNWIQVVLEGTLQNTLAIGSRVEIDAGGRTFVRSVSGGDSFCSQSSGVLHFGLGGATVIDELRVYWGSRAAIIKAGIAINQRYTFTEPATSTATQQTDTRPGGFLLNQNYPNPFISNSTISFELAEPGPARLALYNLYGQEVAVLVDDFLPGGTHTAVFKGRDFPSGSYAYSLTTRTGTKTRILSLVK